jgi:D-galactarolactone isomerase
MDGRLLRDRLDTLLALPVPLVVDHVGRFMPPVSPDDDRFRALLTLIDTGRCWVKLSAPYESTHGSAHEGAPHFPTVAALVDALVAHAPERMLWASNWPHPGQSEPLDVDDLRRLLLDWLPTAGLRKRVLVDNPTELYGFAPVTRRPATDPPAHHRLEIS